MSSVGVNDLGHVRVVDYDTPWLPPRAFVPGNNAPSNWVQIICHENISIHDIPFTDAVRAQMSATTSGFVCTRAHHDKDEIHVCHYHYEFYPEKSMLAIVWGGE